MRVVEMFDHGRPVVSFELFPPKDDAAERDLVERTVPELAAMGPGFISVTYGAGGGTRGTTLRVVERIRRDCSVEGVHHLTCVGSTRDDLARVLDETRRKGVTNLLALRGDPPKGQAAFTPVAGGFLYATDLVRFIKAHAAFCIGGACYPEGHVECPDKQLDWDRTAAKVEAGAEFLITQLFYNWDDFLAMEDYLRTKRQVRVPIIPGVLPFLKAEQIRRFTRMCGARLPAALEARLDRLAHDDEAVRRLGVEVAVDLCRKALAHGVPGLHFYCLNRVASCREVLAELDLLPITPRGAGFQPAGRESPRPGEHVRPRP